MDQPHTILYPVPLLTRKLPSHVYARGLLSPGQCASLVALAEQKGYQHFDESRYGQPGVVRVETCAVTPDEAEFAYRTIATTAARLNHDHWQLSLTGITEAFRVLRYGSGYRTRPHVDRDYRLADSSKLTCITQLVPACDFSGGVLTVAETDVVTLQQGDAVFFPAHEIHAVSAVTEGTRMVLAGWVAGPVLR